MDNPDPTISARVARLVTHRPRVLWVFLALLVAAAGAIIARNARLNSDVLDMLPGHFESVGIYKLADREFSSARELAFGFVSNSDDTDLDGFTEFFASELRKEIGRAHV